jgi:O-antigen ligase
MKSILSKIIYICILIFPIFFIAVPRTTTALATLLALLTIISLFSVKNFRGLFNISEVKLVSIAFGVYTIAIILTQVKLGKFVAYDFQQQGRMLLLLPLFYYIYKEKIELSKMAMLFIPLTAIIGALSSIYFFQGTAEWGSRHTVQHIDPLNFGYLMLFLAFASLIIALRWTRSMPYKAFCLIAFIIGLYMSFKSGSRTGWLAIPIVSLWILFTVGHFKISRIVMIIPVLIMSGLYFYASNDLVFARVTDFTNSMDRYVWSGTPHANETSIGVRISMLRMGWFCFTEAPWFGLGSENLYHILNVDSIRMHATEKTIKFASNGFMHNEFVTQVVKHGIFGGLAYLFILYCVARIYIKSILLKISSPMIDAFIIYIIFAVVASLSTEILVVKPMILFFSFMLACYAGEALWKIQESEVKIQPAVDNRIGTRLA